MQMAVYRAEGVMFSDLPLPFNNNLVCSSFSLLPDRTRLTFAFAVHRMLWSCATTV